MFIVKPYVKLPATATFIEGEKMELECIVYGFPVPEISWRFGKPFRINFILLNE